MGRECLTGIAAGSGHGGGNGCIRQLWRLPGPGTGGRHTENTAPHKRLGREKLCKVGHVSALHG